MQSLRYSITLNEAQLDYLSDEQQDILRSLQGRPCPAVGLQSEDGNPHRPRVQPAWHPPVRINQPNHHPHADLPVSLVHRLEIDKERFLRQ